MSRYRVDPEPIAFSYEDVANLLAANERPRMAALVRRLGQSDQEHYVQYREAIKRINEMAAELAALKGLEPAREPATYRSEWE